MTTATKLKLHTMLGNYPNTKAIKSGAVRSDLVDFDFVEVKVANQLFKQVVREAKYDLAELAIVTYLQARTFGKPYVLLPAVVVSRGQHHTIAYNADRGVLKPSELAGKRVGVRAYTVTTGTWVRGILAAGLRGRSRQGGVDHLRGSARRRSIAIPDHQARAARQGARAMLLDGELDAAVVGDKLPDPRLQAAHSRRRRRGAPVGGGHDGVPINHMVVVRKERRPRGPTWCGRSSGSWSRASARRHRRPTARRSIRCASGSRRAGRTWRSSSIIACVKSSSRKKSRSMRCSMTSPVPWRREGCQCRVD